MKKPHLHVMMVLIALALFGGCKKEVVDDPKDPIPSITGVDVSPTTVREFQDSIVFAVHYRDGDGDLGENSPNAKNLFLVDNRLNITEEYRISQLAPSGSNIPITGTLRVVLPATAITDASNSQSGNFTIYIRDRAGHESPHFITVNVNVIR